MHTPGELGRRIPKDFEHLRKYPYRALSPEIPEKIEKLLKLPYYHRKWDQGNEGACVGFGTSMMLAILNENQAKLSGSRPYVRLYDPHWLWDRAKEVDEWSDTNPGDSNGTSVRAACDILRDLGAVRVVRGVKGKPDIAEGIAHNRWAMSVDEIRASIYKEVPVSLGVTWYTNFDNPVKKGREYWIGEGDLGKIRGGHCVCLYGASDKRQAFRIKNSWGSRYPLVWIPYSVIELLLKDYGEASLVTDR